MIKQKITPKQRVFTLMAYPYPVEIGLGLDQGLVFSCTQRLWARVQAQAFFDLPGVFLGLGFFLDYRPRIRPRSRNQTQNPVTGPGFSKFPISNIQFLR